MSASKDTPDMVATGTAQQPLPAETPQKVNGVSVARSIPLKGVALVTARRLLESRQTTASVTAMAEVDATTLLGMHKRLREEIPGLTLTHLLLRAVALCLRQHPRLNATMMDETVYEFAEVNISLALSLPSDDLTLATIRHADTRSLADLMAETSRLRDRSLAGKLSLEDVRGGVFTLSNYGMLRNVVWATPILTPGQAGVLGIGRVTYSVVPDESERGFTLRPILPLSLTYDHRIVNGVPAGRFIDNLAELLATESWATPEGGNG